MPKPLKPSASVVPLGYKDAPPKNPVDARKWIQEAVRSERYTPKHHVFVRLRERQLTMDDLLHALERPRTVEAYPGMPEHGGSCWRVFGRDLEGDQEVGVGVEAYLDEQGRWAVLCTIFPVRGPSR